MGVLGSTTTAHFSIASVSSHDEDSHSPIRKEGEHNSEVKEGLREKCPTAFCCEVKNQARFIVAMLQEFDAKVHGVDEERLVRNCMPTLLATASLPPKPRGGERSGNVRGFSHFPTLGLKSRRVKLWTGEN